MWIFTSRAFISAVEHREDPRLLVVRARLEGDLTAFFHPQRPVIEETRTADYRFRTIVSRAALKNALARTVDEIRYDNFKNSVVDHARHHAYMGVWSAMNRAQHEQMDPPKPFVFTPFTPGAPGVAGLPGIDEITVTKPVKLTRKAARAAEQAARLAVERAAMVADDEAVVYEHEHDLLEERGFALHGGGSILDNFLDDEVLG